MGNAIQRAHGHKFGASLITAIALWLAIGASPAVAQDERASLEELEALSIEDLLDVEVTSVSKRAEQRSQAPAAIHVITSEDIDRSTARTIPGLLRTVPGFHVARLNRSTWSVTARGFSGQFNNKLLVLVDGRSVYTSSFSGVHWQDQSVLLENIERIEIIRGPGGALWGANAVNGVINVVTKDAQETQGGLLRLGGGTEEQGFGAIRYGGKLNDDAFYRVYAEYEQWDEGLFQDGSPSNDDWSRTHAGLRLDWRPDERDHLTLTADINQADINSTVELPFRYPPRRRRVNTANDFEGFHVLGRWTRTFSEDSEISVQAYVDQYYNPSTTIDDRMRVYDVEFQHSFRPHRRHEIVWGGGIRHIANDVNSTRFIGFFPESRSDELYSAFVQDTIRLHETFDLTIGSKIEHNDYTGAEIQPNVRFTWTPTEATTVWGAISRAVRTPSRVEDDGELFFISAPFLRVVLRGNRDFESEEVTAYELGFRHNVRENLAFDLALFYNDYDSLRTVELRAPHLSLGPPVALVAPFEGANNMEAQTYGAEAALHWRATNRLRLRATYSYLDVDTDLRPRTVDFVSGAAEGDTPAQQFSLETFLDLRHNLELSTVLRYVDRLPAFGLDGYTAFDAGLTWQPRDNLEVALVGRKLFDSERFEFSPTFVDTVPTQNQRGIYGEITWTF